MKPLILVALLAVAETLAGTTTAENPDSDGRTKIPAMEHIWSQAYVIKDPRALETILDDAFVSIDWDGKVQTKAEVLAEVKTSSAQQVVTESMIVHSHGNTAIVTGVLLIKGVAHGKPYAHQQRFVDTWLFKNERWVSIAGLVTRIGQ